MKRSVLVATFVAVSVIAFGAGRVIGGPPPPPPLGTPGGHLFGLSPLPNQFPPHGPAEEIIPLIGRIELDVEDCLIPPFPVDLVGTMVLRFPNPLDNAGPATTMDIEIVRLSLVSVAPLTVDCGDGSDFVAVDLHQAGPLGELVDPTNQANGQFPAGVNLNPHVAIEIPGLTDELHAMQPLPFNGRTVGWPPLGIHLMPDPILPMVLQDESNAPAGFLEEMVLLPVTPAEAFMKGESIEHELEQRSFDEFIQEAIEAIDGTVTPLPGQVAEIQEFLEAMRGAIDEVARQTQGGDDCGDGSDPCLPLFENDIDKLLKKVNRTRRLVQQLR